jgi:hypothetical protein
MRGFWFLTTLVLPLAACSLTLPVRGQTEAGDETFIGTATGEMDGGGVLEITTSRGTTCRGSFVYVSSRHGRGTFQCSDGRSGPFEFVSTGVRGSGTGRLGGRLFTFTFG